MKLFISYARENSIQTSEISDIFRSGGHDPWYDTELLPGQDWKVELKKAIGGCDVFVYLLSQDSLRSEWCDWEFSIAIQLNKAILPILLESNLAIPPAIRHLQCCDFSKGMSAALGAKLIHALDFTQNIPSSMAPPVPANPQGAPSRAEALFGVTQVLIDGFGSKPKYTLDQSEKVLGKFVAKYLKTSWTSTGGVIIATNRRLIFESGSLQFIKVDPFDIPLNDISQMNTSNILMIPIGLTIRCRSGKEFRFSMYWRNKLIQLVQEQQGKR